MRQTWHSNTGSIKRQRLVARDILDADQRGKWGLQTVHWRESHIAQQHPEAERTPKGLAVRQWPDKPRNSHNHGLAIDAAFRPKSQTGTMTVEMPHDGDIRMSNLRVLTEHSQLPRSRHHPSDCAARAMPTSATAAKK
jgi:hypothetical protein